MTAQQPIDLTKTAPNWLLSLRRFWLSPLFSSLLLLLCVATTALSQWLDFLSSPQTPAKEGLAGTVVLVGALVLLTLLVVILITSDDTLATTTPFLLLTVLVSSCYDGYALFAPMAPLALPAAAALIFHFVCYRGRLQIGPSFAPLIAVSVAVTLGGVGCLSAREYFSPAALYYVAGLGFGMVLIYLLLKAALSRRRDYDVATLLLRALYLVGLYAACFTLIFYAVRGSWLVHDLKTLGHPLLFSIDNRNVYATFLLLGLPAPFYHAAKGRGLHLIPALLFYTALLLTGSRGGLLAGTALLALCFFYLLRRDKAHRRRNLILLAVLGLCALAAGGLLMKFYTERFADGFIVGDEPRMLLLKRAVGDFLYHPIFGVGLGYTGNADIYTPKTFAMNWYHMMIPQIVSGLGIVGVSAYTFLFWRRARLIKESNAAPLRALALSYIGLFLMTQVNPGEFCPIPFTLIAVMIFIVLENSVQAHESEKARKAEQIFTALLAHALFNKPMPPLAQSDLDAVLALADAHAVYGVVSEGLSDLPEGTLTKEQTLDLQEKTVTLLRHNEALSTARASLCAFLQKQGIAAVILKGDSVAALYPTPDLRVSGDIDCLLHERDVETVATALEEKGYCRSAAEDKHHVTLYRDSIKIELHHRVSGLPDGAVGDRLRALLEDTLQTATTAEINGVAFPVADDLHQALILLLHMQQHMREGGLGLRQVSDWALFVAKGLDSKTTPRLLDALHTVGLYRFAAAVTLGCCRHLGLPHEKYPFAEQDEAQADALFADFMASGNFGRGNADFAGSGIVTLHRTSGKGALATALTNVSEKCKAAWPICSRHPVLLGVLVPFWIARRLLKAPIRPLSMLQSSAARGKLYDDLKLFEKDER
ncbi:MAG: hypothetical protein E7639_04180 [Ruminococcaceae bacterium]|nr:hypothetical protein [Oscillospiraceae bacterium]